MAAASQAQLILGAPNVISHFLRELLQSGSKRTRRALQKVGAGKEVGKDFTVLSSRIELSVTTCNYLNEPANPRMKLTACDTLTHGKKHRRSHAAAYPQR